MKQPVFRSCYSDWKLIKSRGVVQIVLEVPIAESDHAYEVLGGMPRPGAEIWCGVARLEPGREVMQNNAENDRPGSGASTSVHSDNAQPRQIAAQPSGGAPTCEISERLSGGRPWAQLVPSEQAGILCAERAFWKFLKDEHNYDPRNSDDAAETVREICGVASRRDIATYHRAKMIWHALVEEYRLWQRAPECVP